MIQLLICTATLGCAHGEAELWRAAAVSITSEPDPAGAGGGLLLPDIAAVRWSAEPARGCAVDFLSLPGDEMHWERGGDESVPQRPTDCGDWRDLLDSLAWASPGPVLSLRPSSDPALLVGHLDLRVPEDRGGPTSELWVTEVLAGCALRVEPAVPFELGCDARRVEFTWDRHQAQEPDGSWIVLRSESRGLLPRIPVRSAAQDWLTVEPAELLLQPHVDAYRIRVQARTGDLQLTEVRCPLALQLGEVRQLGAGTVEVHLRRMPPDGRRHRPKPVMLELRRSGDPEPYYRTVGVELIEPPSDPDGIEMLTAVLLPGEIVGLAERAHGGFELTYPLRFPRSESACASEAGAAEYGTALSEPDACGELVLSSGSSRVRVRYRTSAALAPRFGTWAAAALEAPARRRGLRR